MTVQGNKIEQFNISFEELEISKERIFKLLGNSFKDTSASYSEKLKDSLKVASEKCSIKGGFSLYDNIEVIDNEKSIQVEDKTFFTGDIITNNLQKAGSVAFFLCTAGPGIENISKELMDQGDLLEGYLLDILGSEIVEAATGKIQDKLEIKMQQSGLKITNRYSPGYCGWEVKEQHKLFSFFPESFCGVTLTESAFMNPKKSVSGIIGIGKNVTKDAYPCKICDFEDCIYKNRI